MRKISAQEFERGGLIKPMVTTIDGTPTFLSPPTSMDAKMGLTSRKSREELQVSQILFHCLVYSSHTPILYIQHCLFSSSSLCQTLPKCTADIVTTTSVLEIDRACVCVFVG